MFLRIKIPHRTLEMRAASAVFLVAVAAALQCVASYQKTSSRRSLVASSSPKATFVYMTSNSDSNDIDDNVRATARIKEEIANPLRKVRFFLYASMFMGGGLGTITTLPQLLFAVQDGAAATATSGVADGGLTTILTNLGIDVGAAVAGIVLYLNDMKDESAKLERFVKKEQQLSNQLKSTDINDREKEIGMLPIEIIFSENDVNTTRIVSVSDIQAKGKQNIVIVAGSQAFVRDSVISARIEGNDLFNSKNTFVVPVVMQGKQLNEVEASKGFAAMESKDSLMEAPYIAKPAQVAVWERYLQKEVGLAELQGAKDIVGQGIVIAVARSGKVVRRGLGVPAWKSLISEVESKISNK